MSQKENILYAQVERKGEKLEFLDPVKRRLYTEFIENLEEGQVADLFLDANVDDGTLPQLAKIHASIREIAKTSGHSFSDIKLEVKHNAGLCVKKNLHGEDFLICKSFAHCSKSELALAMQAIEEIGKNVGIVF